MSRSLLITGDRRWRDLDLIVEVFEVLPADTLVIEGEADGADKLSREAAERLGLAVEPVPAQWEPTEDTPPARIRKRRDGKLYDVAAGPIRNQVMVDRQPDAALVIHDDLENSRGTADCVRRIAKAGIPWVHLTHQEAAVRDCRNRLAELFLAS